LGAKLLEAAGLVASAHYRQASCLLYLSYQQRIVFLIIYPCLSAVQEGLIGRGYAGPAVALDGETLSEAQVTLTRHASRGDSSMQS
jgi:hypothetical protein